MNEYVLLNNNNKIILVIPEIPFLLNKTHYLNFDNIYYDLKNGLIILNEMNKIQIEFEHQPLIISSIKNGVFEIAITSHDNKISVMYSDLELKSL